MSKKRARFSAPLFSFRLGGIYSPARLGLMALLATFAAGSAHAQIAAPIPFYEGFESAKLSPWWTVKTTGQGYAALSTNNGPKSGLSQLVIASLVDATASEAEVTVALDLAGKSGLQLGFSHKEFEDEDNPKDGIWISDDSVTWFKVKSLVGADGSSGPRSPLKNASPR